MIFLTKYGNQAHWTYQIHEFGAMDHRIFLPLTSLLDLGAQRLARALFSGLAGANYTGLICGGFPCHLCLYCDRCFTGAEGVFCRLIAGGIGGGSCGADAGGAVGARDRAPGRCFP